MAAATKERRRRQPRLTAATLQSLTVSGLGDELAIGDCAQLAARGDWSDGRSEDVSSRVRWSSRSVACLITPAGAVTANEVGDCTVDASLDSRSATALTRVTPRRTFVVSGVVREKYELREPPIPNATVTVASGSQAGRTVTTDGLGRFTFDGVPLDRITLRAEARDFETTTVDASPDTPSVDVFLPPEMVTLRWDNRTGGIALPDSRRFRDPHPVVAPGLCHVIGVFDSIRVRRRRAGSRTLQVRATTGDHSRMAVVSMCCVSDRHARGNPAFPTGGQLHVLHVSPPSAGGPGTHQRRRTSASEITAHEHG